MALEYPAISRARRWLERTCLRRASPALLERLTVDGYRPDTVARYLRVAAHFGQWLDSQHLPVTAASAQQARRFLEHHLPQCRCRARVTHDRKTVRAALCRLAEVRRGTGPLGARQPAAGLPPSVRQAVQEYEQHLSRARGAALAYRTLCRRYVSDFLVWKFGRRPVVPQRLCAADLRGYLLHRAADCRPGTLGVIATALRSWLRYLVYRGYGLQHLGLGVPAVARWSHARLPQHLTHEQERRFLQAPQRRQPSGQRDYATFLLMCRLGLRVSDVVGLRLEDIDWQHGILTVRVAKSRRTQLLPLPALVSRAIAAYLCHGRPRSADRHLFLRHRAPLGRAVSCEVVRGAVRRAYQRAGLPPSWTGTHRLRHTAAARMVQAHASLKQIADVLGHAAIDTTAIYAKIDLAALRAVALPWPGRRP